MESEHKESLSAERANEDGVLEIPPEEFFAPFPHFPDYLREHRSARSMRLTINLTNVTNKDEFIGHARRMKAFFEKIRLSGKSCEAMIICSPEQESWEPNVFSSGVKALRP
jgi:hypothetical protein